MSGKKIIIAIIAAVLLVTVVFFIVAENIVKIIADFVINLVKDSVTAVGNFLKEAYRKVFKSGEVEASMNIVLLDNQSIEELKNTLESNNIDTKASGLTNVRLRKMLLAYNISKNLEDTVCVVPVAEKDIIEGINDKKNAKTDNLTDALDKCITKESKNVFPINVEFWESKKNYILYYESKTFFYFQDENKMFGDNQEQWYLGALGATQIEGYENVTKEKFEEYKTNFLNKAKNTTDNRLEATANEAQLLFNSYYKKDIDTIAVATVTSAQKSYYYTFDNANLGDNAIKMVADLNNHEDAKYKDKTVTYTVSEKEVKISSILENNTYAIPLELMIDLLEITGSGEFLEEFLDYAVNNIKVEISSAKTTDETREFNKTTYNIAQDYIAEVYDLAAIANNDSGDDNFIAYKSMIYDRTEVPSYITSVSGFEEINNDGQEINGKKVSCQPLHTYLKNAHTGKYNGHITVTEGIATISRSTNIEFVPSKISTWFGDIKYSVAEKTTTYLVPSGETGSSEFENFGFENLTDSDSVSKSDENVKIKYMSENVAKQGNISPSDEDKVLTSITGAEEDIFDEALVTEPGVENYHHFSNWTGRGLILLNGATEDKYNDLMGAGDGCDYIYTKYAKTNVKNYTGTAIKKEIIDQSNLTSSMSGDDVETKLLEFLKLLKNENGEKLEQNPNIVFDRNGKAVRYGDVYKGTIPAGDLLLDNGALMLFELLDSQDNTRDLVKVFKYMAYLYTGEDYGVSIEELTSFFTFNTMSGIYGGSVEEKIWYSLKALGLSDYAVAGVMGNIYIESGGFKPNNLENQFESKLGYTDETYTKAVDDGTYSKENFISDHTSDNCGAGYGLAQWTFYTRKEGLYDYCKEKGVSISDTDAQIEYLIAEITGSGPASRYASKCLGTNKGYTESSWKDAQTVEDATVAFCWIFEKPSSPNMDSRIENATKYMNTYQGKTIPTTGNFNGTFLQIAEQCHEYLRINNYYYDHGATIPLDAKRSTFADCSSYVSWVLYEYGYEDFGGHQHVCKDFINNKDNYTKKYGWKYKSTEKALEGDIIVRSDHMEIYAGNGRYLNAGSTDAMRRPLSGGEWGTSYLSNFTYAITIPKK